MSYLSAPPKTTKPLRKDWKAQLAEGAKKYGPAVAMSLVFGPAAGAVALVLQRKAEEKKRREEQRRKGVARG